MSLQTVDGPGLKAELEASLSRLEEERKTLMRDIESLKESVAIKTLERDERRIQSEVEALRVQKTELEERLKSFSDASPYSV